LHVCSANDPSERLRCLAALSRGITIEIKGFPESVGVATSRRSAKLISQYAQISRAHFGICAALDCHPESNTTILNGIFDKVFSIKIAIACFAMVLTR
jgi:hypothetical protein